MYCNKCGKQIEEDSIFCQFCGNNVDENNIEPQKESSSKKEKMELKPAKKNKADLLWEKFAEIYDAEDEDRKKFDELSSEYNWELIERLYTNAFETFIKDKKDELNSQPYKAIEALKNLYLHAVLGGYRLWIAEALLEEKKLDKFKSFSLDDIIEGWKSYDFQELIKEISDEMGNCMSRYLDFRMNGFMEVSSSIKEVSNATVEELRNSITFQIINGYFLGELENRFRK